MDNVLIALIIENIVQIIGIILIIIAIIAIINYILYTIFSIQAIIKENLSDTSISYKLHEIYNYMLVNYVHILNKNRNIKYQKVDTYYLINEISDDRIIVDLFNKDNQYVFDIDNEKKKEENEDKRIILEELSNELSNFKNIIYYYDYDEIKNQEKYNKDLNVVYIYSNKKYNNNKIYIKFQKVTETNDILNIISKYLWYLVPTNMMQEYDDKATYLYVHLNKKLYEVIAFILFIIIFVVIIKFCYALCSNLLSTINNQSISNDINFMQYLYNYNFKHLIIIPTIFAVCMIHSMLYKKLFIDNVYNTIYNTYTELIKPDEYVRSEIDNIYSLNDISINDNNDKYFLFNNTINNLKSIVENVDSDLLPDNEKEFNDRMIRTNKVLKFTLYKNKKYVKKYINSLLKYYIRNIKKYKNNLYTDDKSEENNTEIKNLNNIAASYIFILSVYNLFLYNNLEDPHILIKLNKLIMGKTFKTNIDKVDKDIEYTLTLRSLLNADLNMENIKGLLSNIIEDGVNVFKDELEIYFYEYDVDVEKIHSYVDNNVKNLLNGKNEKFIELLNTANDSVNFVIPVYFFNLYLTTEMFIVALAIYIILVSIYNFDLDENIGIKEYGDSQVNEQFNNIASAMKDGDKEQFMTNLNNLSGRASSGNSMKKNIEYVLNLIEIIQEEITGALIGLI